MTETLMKEVETEWPEIKRIIDKAKSGEPLAGGRGSGSERLQKLLAGIQTMSRTILRILM